MKNTETQLEAKTVFSFHNLIKLRVQKSRTEEQTLNYFILAVTFLLALDLLCNILPL